MPYNYDDELKARNEWILEQNHGVWPPQSEFMKWATAYHTHKSEETLNDPEKRKEVVEQFLKNHHSIR